MNRSEHRMNGPEGYPYFSRKLVKEDFYDEGLLKAVWGKPWGVENPVERLRQVLVHRPGEELARLDEEERSIESGPLLLHQIRGTMTGEQHSEELDVGLVQAQHDALVAALKQEGVEIVYLEGSTAHWPEAIFTRDMAMVVPGGCILSRPALYIRHGETGLAARTLQQAGMPILGCIQGEGYAEGGSFTMLDAKTAVIGRSERVNLQGIEQVRFLLSLQGVELIVVDLPASIIHLDEAFLLLDERKALVNIHLLPFWYLDELHKRDFELLHVDPRDPPLAINGLAVEPGRVLMSADSVRTIELVSRYGVDVIPLDISEIQKMGGGIHCCTLPLHRERGH